MRHDTRVEGDTDGQQAERRVPVYERAWVFPGPSVGTAELADLGHDLRRVRARPDAVEKPCDRVVREVREQHRRFLHGHRVDGVGVHRVDRGIGLERRIVDDDRCDRADLIE